MNKKTRKAGKLDALLIRLLAVGIGALIVAGLMQWGLQTALQPITSEKRSTGQERQRGDTPPPSRNPP